MTALFLYILFQVWSNRFCQLLWYHFIPRLHSMAVNVKQRRSSGMAGMSLNIMDRYAHAQEESGVIVTQAVKVQMWQIILLQEAGKPIG